MINMSHGKLKRVKTAFKRKFSITEIFYQYNYITMKKS